MQPNSVAVYIPEFSDAEWQKAKTPIDKATKTGLGAELVKLQAAYAKAKQPMTKLDAGMVGKLRDEDEVKQAKAEAIKTLASSDVKAFMAALVATAKEASAVSKLKLSSSAKKYAQDAATELQKIKADLDKETFADFDQKLDHMQKLYAAQRTDFKDSVKKLLAVIERLDKTPTLETCKGTDFSGAYRGVQNKIGNLPEFKGVFDGKFDGLWPTSSGLEKKLPDEIKKALQQHAKESRLYVAKILSRAKAAGY